MSELQEKILTGSMTEKKYNCETHGDFLSKPFVFRGKERKLRPPCPICLTQEKKEREKEFLIEKEKQWMKKIETANIPLKFCHLNFRDYDVDVSENAIYVYDIISTYYNKFYSMSKKGTSLTFLGLPGTGKTHLSCTLLNRLLFENKNVYYTTSTEMLSDIKSTYKPSVKFSEKQVMFKYSCFDLLVIDEIGAHENTQKDLSILIDIIDRRYRNNKPIILVSNLVESEFKEYVGERSFDRLKEGKGAVLAFDWESYRK